MLTSHIINLAARCYIVDLLLFVRLIPSSTRLILLHLHFMSFLPFL